MGKGLSGSVPASPAATTSRTSSAKEAWGSVYRAELGSFDPTLLERFKQEIRLARRITHRNVVRTYDLGEVSGVYYITMEYVRGTALSMLIKESGKLEARAIWMARSPIRRR